MTNHAVAVTSGYDARLRGNQVRLGLWMFLGTVTMLFAAFASAYIVRRSGSDWKSIDLPPILWFNTAVLAASSVALEGANRQADRRRWGQARILFLAAIALGVGFLAGQVVAWGQLVQMGVYLPSDPHSSFVYMLTAAHALHIVPALVVLTWGAVALWRGGPARGRTEWETRLSVCRTFWHFLGAVWVCVFALLTL
jgi:cytochrome c oxidase subunit 3